MFKYGLLQFCVFCNNPFSFYKNIRRLYEPADYDADVDPIFRGIVNGVYVPFSLSDDFRLVGASEQVKEEYLSYYDRIHLKDRMRSSFYQYFKYGNVYCCLMKDGDIITPAVEERALTLRMIGYAFVTWTAPHSGTSSSSIPLTQAS